VSSPFILPDSNQCVRRSVEHGGCGEILFRRLATSREFQSGIDFIDLTRIPPGSCIGAHQHTGNEEIYFIAEGSPLVRVNGAEARLSRGSVSIVRHQEWHELINDTNEDVEILVVQVAL
jgi:mannose-6-phosphate isomerase-like protein (cupin superfamily)